MSELEELCREIRNCQKCRLVQGRTNAVPGAGAEDADIMFVGEAPGFHEDQQGLPFVGAAGSYLDELLASINLSREKVYITNVIKCRPPNNRDPREEEIRACQAYLDRQIELINPKMIVTLGRFSMQLAWRDVRISRIHGRPKRIDDVVYYPVFHPAAALHQPKYRSMIEQDFLKIPEILADIHSVQESDRPEPPAEQMSLF